MAKNRYDPVKDLRDTFKPLFDLITGLIKIGAYIIREFSKFIVFIVSVIIGIVHFIIKMFKRDYNPKYNYNREKEIGLREKNKRDSTIKEKTVKKDIVYEELEGWQKKEVDQGKYDSYNFEEEELEEDDYYYEDDK